MPQPESALPPPPPRKGLKRLLITALKIIIAIAGLWFVLRQVTWFDTVVLSPTGEPIKSLNVREETTVRVVANTFTPKGEPVYRIRFPDTPLKVRLDTPDGPKDFELIIAEETTIPGTNEKLNIPRELDVDPSRLKPIGEAKPGEPRQYLSLGLQSLLIQASGKWYLLLAAWALLGTPFLVTAIRWRNLMRPQGIDMPLWKCIQLTFVGQFYSIMLPGITGGDLVKIVYAARLTGSKTKSFITVILDRVIGLVALMVIAGSSALGQLIVNRNRTGVWLGVEGDHTLLNVALLIGGILLMMLIGCTLYFSRRLRRMSGLQKILDHPRVPEFVKHADGVLHAYRGHFGLLVWAFLISLMSQLTLPLSAWLSGLALGMTAPMTHYLAYVPLAILAASLPISPPQGLGFLEWVLNHFFVARGAATSSQAMALTQAVRFLPIFWNLCGAYWVITGRYSRQQIEKENAAAIQPTPTAPG